MREELFVVQIVQKRFVATPSLMNCTKILGGISTFFCIVFQLHSKKILSFQEVRNPGIVEDVLYNGTSSRGAENCEVKIQLL